jgi:hypothetical protein
VQKGFSPILAILIIAVALGVIAFTQKDYLLNSKPAPTTVNLQPTPISDPTSDWKTYSNSIYSYSFHYPPNYSVKENANTLTISEPNSQAWELEVEYLTDEVKYSDSSVKDYIESTLVSLCPNPDGTDGVCEKVAKSTTFTTESGLTVYEVYLQQKSLKPSLSPEETALLTTGPFFGIDGSNEQYPTFIILFEPHYRTDNLKIQQTAGQNIKEIIYSFKFIP